MWNVSDLLHVAYRNDDTLGLLVLLRLLGFRVLFGAAAFGRVEKLSASQRRYYDEGAVSDHPPSWPWTKS